MVLEYSEGPHDELSEDGGYVQCLLVECQVLEVKFRVFNIPLSYFQLSKHADAL